MAKTKTQPNQPVVALPAPKEKTKGAQSTKAVFLRWIKAHKGMGKWADQIWRQAHNYGLDPIVFACLVWQESRGVPKERQESNGTISYGLGQINSVHIGERFAGTTITEEMLKNPTFNLQYAAYLYSQGLDNNGNYTDAYSGAGGYNPGAPDNPTNYLPKGYVPIGAGRSPTESAQRSVETATAKQELTDPYIYIDKKGRIKYTSDPTDKRALKYNGLPITASQFLNMWHGDGGYDDMFLSYTGKKATAKQVAAILKSGITPYALTRKLVNSPRFVGSPVWNHSVNDYEAIGKSIYGNNWAAGANVDDIRKAVLNNWDGEAFANYLRKKPAYTTSVEFESNEASLSNIYRTIYGKPDAQAEALIFDAAKEGWTADQWASYLRSQDAYKTSGEYKGNLLAFLTQLGLITGNVPTLQAGQTLPSAPSDTEELGGAPKPPSESSSSTGIAGPPANTNIVPGHPPQ